MTHRSANRQTERLSAITIKLSMQYNKTPICLYERKTFKVKTLKLKDFPKQKKIMYFVKFSVQS